MDNGLITLAIHTPAKANVLKSVLEKNGIAVFLDEINDINLEHQVSYYVRINRKDLTKSLSIIENLKLFSYDDKNTHLIDDGNKRILVPVDFSSHSLKACQVAFNIAKNSKAKVKILHVYHNIYFPSHIPFADSLKEAPDEGSLNSARKQMLNFCIEIDRKIAEGEWPSINYSYSIREGILEEEVDNFVQEYKPFLLVLGTKGKNNVIGEVTADIIEMVNVPILTVPESSPINSFSDVKHFAFLTNLQNRDLSTFDFFVSLLSSYTNLKITLVHINRINRKGDKLAETELLGMKEHFKKRYPQLNVGYKLIDSDDIPKAIVEFTEQENVTVACINTRKRNIFGRIFAPSLSRKVLVLSDALILILRG